MGREDDTLAEFILLALTLLKFATLEKEFVQNSKFAQLEVMK